jgi:peptidoglycan/LPS O-acetylase OafA/YrhL
MRELSKDVLLGTGIGIGYFVIVLIQYILLTPVLARLNGKRTHIILMATLFACGLLVTYVARAGHPNSRWAQYPFYCLSFIVWYPFYHLGVFAAKFGIVNSSVWRSRAWIFLLYFAFLAASVAEGIFLCGRGVALGVSQLKATSLLTSVALFLLLLCYHRTGPGRLFSNHFLQLLGKSSYMIYLMHLLVLHSVENLFTKIAMIHDHESIFALSSFLFTLVLCGIAAAFVRKLPRRFGNLLGA